MDERSQLVPLNLCSPAFLLDELKSISSTFLQSPPHLHALQTAQQNHIPGDLDLSLYSRAPECYNLPLGGTPMLLPDYRMQHKTIEEEPKPNFSYIGLIAKAILSSKDRRMVLSEIYEWIQVNYAYFRSRGPGWRNSIRHNLSLNDCFIKVGRSSNGKGHYWGIHPANVEDFRRGDFRRRRAQRKVRRALGLSCPGDGEDSDSPPISPPPQFSSTQSCGFPPLPLRSIANTDRRFLLPSNPSMDMFTALLNSLTTSGILPANQSTLHPSQHQLPPHLPNTQPLEKEREAEECPRGPLQPRPASNSGSFSVASLLGV
ncbi:unnamed protein product [Rodentolepis nana]|uniref:Fork-head domain-containing protein n=1 Tax=Rodentolepis nana TaxID=102285 RepID=A0A0R3T542_RODNA|nr:unnamed protein product [Rodentolepis nana]